jgi:single-strand DNA-binding protein
MSYQQITVLGNLGSVPDMRYTPSGKAFTSFSLAVNEKYKEQETTTWFRVTCWDKLAETASQYLTKGRQVMVVGRVKASAYPDKEGKPAASLEVTADKLVFVGSGGKQDTVPTSDEQVDESNIPF